MNENKKDVKTSPKVGSPRKYETVRQLENAINKYFADCDSKKKPYTVCGLARSLGVDRKTLINYSKDENNPDFFHTIKQAKQIIEEQLETNLYGSSVSGIIFNLKNNFDWKEKQEVALGQDEPFNVKIEVVK